MAKQQTQEFDWNSSANDQLTMLATANGAFVKAFAKASQDYMHGVGELTREFSDFLNVRLQHDVELGDTMAKSRDWSDIAEAQQEWARQAGEAYFAEAQKLAELSVKLATNGTSLFVESAAATEASAEN